MLECVVMNFSRLTTKLRETPTHWLLDLHLHEVMELMDGDMILYRELKIRRENLHTHTYLLAYLVCLLHLYELLYHHIARTRTDRQTDRHPIAYCGWLGRMEGSLGVHFCCAVVDNERRGNELN
jgi:hypothetical protein